jgi:hypothetical protein
MIAGMSAPTPSRNRLAKPLPDAWRRWLTEQGVPKRKYTAVCRATLADGRVIEELVIDQGWIVSLDRSGISGPVEQRIDFDPRTIVNLDLTQFV